MVSGGILSVRDRNRMILLNPSLSFDLRNAYAHVFNIVCGTMRESACVSMCVYACVFASVPA